MSRVEVRKKGATKEQALRALEQLIAEAAMAWENTWMAPVAEAAELGRLARRYRRLLGKSQR